MNLLNLLDRLGRKRVIYDRQDDEPYLERYYVFLKDRKRFPFNIFLHKFLKGDPGHPHDHPWPYATLILKGGYWEYTPVFENDEVVSEVKHWRGPGHFRVCGATSYHRIELEPGVTPWTLFMPGPQRREWGFKVGTFWYTHDEYFQLMQDQKYEIR
jgi:hypothetical protein